MIDRNSRVPLTGRSNRSAISARDAEESNKVTTPSRRPATAHPTLSYHNKDQNVSKLSQRIDEIRDPLRYYRPFTPTNYEEERKKAALPPLLPPSVYPTIPPTNTTPREKKYHRPLSCPQEFIFKQTQPALFDRASMAFDLPEDEKRQHAEEFVQRNQHQMWKFDLSYMKKTPRTIAEDLASNTNFTGVMQKYHQREKYLTLSSSVQTLKCLHANDAHKTPRSLGISTDFEATNESKRPSTSPSRILPANSPYRTKASKGLFPVGQNDFYLTSLTTSREKRAQQVTRLFSQANSDSHQSFLTIHDNTAPAPRETRFNRGFAHEPEYKTFAKFNALLKANKGAVLNR